MSKRHLILRMEAPLLSFGGVLIDNYGFTRDFPARSMLTGLLANALDWRRTQREEHQQLQERLIFAARREHESHIGHLKDVQNARLEKNDKGWTTRGQPEGRAGGGNTYKAPHRRYRDYHPDALVFVALRLEPAEQVPTLDDIARALDHPARPLFFGRKPCLPSSPLLAPEPARFITAPTAGEALARIAHESGETKELRTIWPRDEAPLGMSHADRTIDICDERNWRSGLHGGSRKIVEGRITPQKEARP